MEKLNKLPWFWKNKATRMLGMLICFFMGHANKQILLPYRKHSGYNHTHKYLKCYCYRCAKEFKGNKWRRLANGKLREVL